MNILLVDSKATRRHSIQNLLFSMGFDSSRVQGVFTANDALIILDDKQFNCIFIYAEQFTFNWASLVAQIRETSSFDMLPIVVLSDTPTKKQVIDAYEVGANCFLKYPCTFDDINKALDLVKVKP